MQSTERAKEKMRAFFNSRSYTDPHCDVTWQAAKDGMAFQIWLAFLAHPRKFPENDSENQNVQA